MVWHGTVCIQESSLSSVSCVKTTLIVHDTSSDFPLKKVANLKSWEYDPAFEFTVADTFESPLFCRIYYVSRRSVFDNRRTVKYF